MLRFLTGPILGIISFLIFLFNLLLAVTVFYPVGLIKLLIPLPAWRRFWGKVLDGVGKVWIDMNSYGIEGSRKIEWNIQGLEGLSTKEWYLVISNHQTWIDIVVLQRVFNRRIPFLKFFIKKELIWVPFLGFAWWALDFPFLKRYKKSFIAKHPEMKGKDMEITRKACEKFRLSPVAVMIFVEGTRFTEEKHKGQNSPYRHLLKPKPGSVGLVFSIMGDILHQALNVTIYYPEGRPTFWQFLCGRTTKINVIIDNIPITPELLGDYDEDRELRIRVHQWLSDLWQTQENRLEQLNKK